MAKSNGSISLDTSTPPSNAKRKRSRADYRREATPLHEWMVAGAGADISMVADTVDDGGIGPEHSTRLGIAQSRYVLAGQIETPTGANIGIQNGILEDSVYSDVNYRRELGSKREHGEFYSPSNAATTSQHPFAATTPAGWGNFAFNTIGGMVGKVWEFCKAGAFRGFHAGGGKGYTIGDQTMDTTPTTESMSESTWTNGTNGDVERNGPARTSRPIPGQYPEHNYIPALNDRDSPDITPSRPAAKRRQISGTHEELRRNWVMVDDHSVEHKSQLSSPPRGSVRQSRNSGPSPATGRRISVPVSRLSTSQGVPRRHSHRVSHAGSPSLSSYEPASYAAPRSRQNNSPGVSGSRIPVPAAKVGGIANPFTSTSTKTTASGSIRRSMASLPPQPAFSPCVSHRRTHSGASVASSRGKGREQTLDVDDIEASPRLDAEAKQLAAQKLLEERDTDARIAAFNSRLREMIRQGKEALGTTIEVEGDDDVGVGGGWVDDS
jgi:hypothetical protein